MKNYSFNFHCILSDAKPFRKGVNEMDLFIVAFRSISAHVPKRPCSNCRLCPEYVFGRGRRNKLLAFCSCVLELCVYQGVSIDFLQYLHTICALSDATPKLLSCFPYIESLLLLQIPELVWRALRPPT